MVSFADLPKSREVNFESWWSVHSEYGERHPSNKEVEFHLLDIPSGHVEQNYDHTGDYFLSVRSDIYRWCKDTLSDAWSPRRSRAGTQMIFTSEADMLIYKLRWLDSWLDEDDDDYD